SRRRWATRPSSANPSAQVVRWRGCPVNSAVSAVERLGSSESGIVGSTEVRGLAMRMRYLRGLWLAALLGVSTSGAAPGAAAAEASLADAVQRGDIQAVLALLKTHADVNAPQGDGATALHWAAYLDDAD